MCSIEYEHVMPGELTKTADWRNVKTKASNFTFSCYVIQISLQAPRLVLAVPFLLVHIQFGLEMQMILTD